MFTLASAFIGSDHAAPFFRPLAWIEHISDKSLSRPLAALTGFLGMAPWAILILIGKSNRCYFFQRLLMDNARWSFRCRDLQSLQILSALESVEGSLVEFKESSAPRHQDWRWDRFSWHRLAGRQVDMLDLYGQQWPESKRRQPQGTHPC